MSIALHKERLAQFRKQGGRCWLCDQALDLFLPIHSYGSVSWEHVIPRCHGGSDRLTNLMLTHCECNRARGDRFIWRLERPADFILQPKKRSAQKLQGQFERQIMPHVIKLLRASI